MSESKRVLLRVSSISTEQTSTRQKWDEPPTPAAKMTQVVLVPHRQSAFDVLGGQKVMLFFHGEDHPLFKELALDRVFELALAKEAE